MEATGQGRYQFSVRTLLLFTGVLALLLVPVAWVARERKQMLRAQDVLLQAREVALRSAVLEERRRSEVISNQKNASSGRHAIQPSVATPMEPHSTLDRLQRENDALRIKVEALCRQVEALKARKNQ
jgi:hypothetical protein